MHFFSRLLALSPSPAAARPSSRVPRHVSMTSRVVTFFAAVLLVLICVEGASLPGSLYRTDNCTHDQALPLSKAVEDLLRPPSAVARWNASLYRPQKIASAWVSQFSHITNDQVRALLDPLHRFQECILAQIINGTLWFWGPLASLYDLNKRGFLPQRRYYALLEIHEIVALLPDMEMTLCTGDGPPQDAASARNASFTSVAFYPNCPFPDFRVPCADGSMCAFIHGCIPFSGLDSAVPPHHWNATTEKLISTAQQSHALWSMKNSQAVFRGDERGCDVLVGEDGTIGAATTGQFSEFCGRHLLHVLARECRPELFNVSIFCHERIDLLEQDLTFKYIVYASGNSQWAGRLKLLLFTGSATVKQLVTYGETFVLGLEPWVHYIPVDHRYHNLAEVVRWATENDEAVFRIVQNANTFAHAALRADGMRALTLSLFKQYARKLAYVPTVPEAGAVRFSEYVRGTMFMQGEILGSGVELSSHEGRNSISC